MHPDHRGLYLLRVGSHVISVNGDTKILLDSAKDPIDSPLVAWTPVKVHEMRAVVVVKEHHPSSKKRKNNNEHPDCKKK